MKKILILTSLSVFILLAFLIYSYSSLSNKKSSPQEQRVKVSASFYPLYYFVSRVGGSLVSVKNLTPAGAEPHDYEPSTRDITELLSSDLIVVNGQIESWLPKIKTERTNDKPIILETGNHLFTLNVFQDNTTFPDPHIWLDPTLASKQVQAISDSLIQFDPQHKEQYQVNTQQLFSDLDNLDHKFTQTLSNCQTRNIITSHSAFSYLATRYHLIQTPIAGLSPETEPSLKQMAELSDFAKKNGIKYIFFESLVSPKLSQALSNEIGAKTLVLNPLEGITPDQQKSGENYLTIMEQNLINLKQALQCQ